MTAFLTILSQPWSRLGVTLDEHQVPGPGVGADEALWTENFGSARPGRAGRGDRRMRITRCTFGLSGLSLTAGVERRSGAVRRFRGCRLGHSLARFRAGRGQEEGGLFGKVKGLAGNKVVQSVAKTAACTMVPGGQVIAGAIDAASSKDVGEAAAGAAGAAAGQTCMPGGMGGVGAGLGAAGVIPARLGGVIRAAAAAVMPGGRPDVHRRSAPVRWGTRHGGRAEPGRDGGVHGAFGGGVPGIHRSHSW